jgi:hypothetical protein
MDDADKGAEAVEGIFSWRVGDEPVRAFLAGTAGFIVLVDELLRLSPFACLEDERFEDFVRAGPAWLEEALSAGAETPEGKGGKRLMAEDCADDPCPA